ncbi:hypothetical protein AVEN_185901-1 [Araneus ventricosus]|uniref:Uncharacterized protein n=1 Tax=Araneus ventricosus TaxID=182803 RepID=A0A4Y2Q844_ARAVE|nr:hypothetical protein AVEN_185901-1 [Araneus ventricosus]
MCHWDHPQLKVSAKDSGKRRQNAALCPGSCNHYSCRTSWMEMGWQSPIADRRSDIVGTCASSHSSLHSTKGMRSTDTNPCMCK